MGAITASANTLTAIITSTAGWQSVNNAASATVGNAVVTDTQLQQNQQLAVATPSTTFIAGIANAVAQVANVASVTYVNNTTDAFDINGIPPHTFSMVVKGGATADIATAIALSKPPGIGTYGSASYVYVDANGVPETIYYAPVTQVEIDATITIKILAGWQATTGSTIQTAVFNFINSLPVGADCYISWLESAAQLGATGIGATFKIVSVTQALHSGSQTTADLVSLYYQEFFTNLTDITVVLT